MEEMLNRGYNISVEWLDMNYRGKKEGSWDIEFSGLLSGKIYTEHDEEYLEECIVNLKKKGIVIIS